MRLAAPLAAALLALAACGDTAGESTTATGPAATAPPSSGPPPASTAPAPTTTLPPSAPAIAATPVGNQLAWVLGALGGADLAEPEVAARFDDFFLSQVPADQLLVVFGQLGDQLGTPVTVVETVGETDTEGAWIIGGSRSDDLLRLSMSVAAEAPHRITGLLFTPAEPPVLEDPPQTWEELSGQLGELAAEVGVLAAEVVDGECAPIHATRADDVRFAIGSVFKLYVLGALADAVAAGDVAWDDPLAVRDDLKSLPSGTMQNEEAGTEFTVFEFARQMISISDNTATDHLIDLLGRDAVESALQDLGHADPGANVPFLTAREMFVLTLVLDAGEVAAYLELDPAGARVFLDEDVAGRSLDDVDLSRLAAPTIPGSLGWFASPLDMCRALVGLLQRAEEPGLQPIRDVLATPPDQLGVDGGPWNYLAFKGGSGPGVLALAVLGERDDGRTFLFAGALNDEDRLVDELTAVRYLGEAMRLLAEAG